MRNPNSPSSPYWYSFITLYDDLENTFRYIHPTDAHLHVYSLRYYELLLRACTEFESICKDLLIQNRKSTKDPKDFNIKDYFLLEDGMGYSKFRVGYNFFMPSGLFKQPLLNWRTDYKLLWYQEYNQVKHNRNSEFEKANLSNVLDAIAAFYIIGNASGHFGFTISGNNENTTTEKDGMIYSFNYGHPVVLSMTSDEYHYGYNSPTSNP